jgi:hypothetical protein
MRRDWIEMIREMRDRGLDDVYFLSSKLRVFFSNVLTLYECFRLKTMLLFMYTCCQCYI